MVEQSPIHMHMRIMTNCIAYRWKLVIHHHVYRSISIYMLCIYIYIYIISAIPLSISMSASASSRNLHMKFLDLMHSTAASNRCPERLHDHGHHISLEATDPGPAKKGPGRLKGAPRRKFSLYHFFFSNLRINKN